MKSEIILRAMGQLRDDLIIDAAIEKSDCHAIQPREKQRKTPAVYRGFRLGVAAALIVILLGTTVFAASWFFRLRMGDPAEVFTPTDGDGNSCPGKSYDISFLLPLNENPPAVIESYYFPDVPEIYEHSFGFAYAGMKYDKLGAIVYAWDVPDGEKHGIMFYQESNFETNEIQVNVTGTRNTAPETKEIVLGGIQGVLITEPKDKEYAHHYFYWSDGDYVFHMRFPADFTEEQMAEIIESIIKVDNIQPYLVSMTDEELNKTFG